MGVGAPNDTRGSGKTMCAIVLTKDQGFIRIYPIPAVDEFPVWSDGFFEIEKGLDPRSGTWKLISYRLRGKIECSQTKREILESCVIKSGFDDPMDFQNSNKQSIFIVRPNWGNVSVALTQKVPKKIPEDDEECGWIVTQWAEKNGKAVRIDRGTLYGNPFVLGQDGDRDTVCDSYGDHYLPHKPSILKAIPSLKGKVLICHCYPERCHGESLI